MKRLKRGFMAGTMSPVPAPGWPRLLAWWLSGTILLGLLVAPAVAADKGVRVRYVGGTVAEFEHGPKGRLYTTDDLFLEFRSKKVCYPIPWDNINLLEYGQRVSRRIAMAIIVSPLLVLSKSRKHFVTIGFKDKNGRQQALVFRVDKNDVRALLLSLETKADIKVEYQDEEARKAGEG